MLALQTVIPTREMHSEAWWNGEWRHMPEDRTRLISVTSRRFNAQVAVDRNRISSLLEQAGWERVPDTDWRWILQALNPEPDQASLPLLGRAYQGRSEQLLLRRRLAENDRLLTVRMWDSGVRLLPDNKTLYLAQLSEELLVQRLGFFSYWKSVPLRAPELDAMLEILKVLDQKIEKGGLLLLRDAAQAD
jgi:hypothetical protein